jgi:hypothetical protein
MPNERMLLPRSSVGVMRIDRAWVLAGLKNGPRSTTELGISVDLARALRVEGTIAIDPDRFPDEYVPHNPMVCRLPNDEAAWPGWSHWNV